MYIYVYIYTKNEKYKYLKETISLFTEQIKILNSPSFIEDEYKQHLLCKNHRSYKPSSGTK